MIMAIIFLLLNLASNLQAIDNESWDFGETVELDICGTSKIQFYLARFLENCRRTCGYDSWAFIQAKKTLNDYDSRIKLVFATLAVLKYPAIDDTTVSSNYLIEELMLIWPWNINSDSMQEFQSIINSKSYLAICDNLKSLNQNELYAVAQNLRDRDNLLTVGEHHQVLLPYLPYLEEILRPILTRLLKE